MRRLARLGALLATGVVLGALGAMVLAGPDPSGSTPADEPVVRSADRPVAPETAAPPPASSRPQRPPGTRVLLAWTAGGLPQGFGDAVAGLPGVQDHTVVRGDLLGLVGTDGASGAPVQRVEPGWRIPLDVLAIDPRSYQPFVRAPADRAAIGALGPGEALLGATSAGLRGIGVGGRLLLDDGSTLRVKGVVGDRAVAGAEAVVDTGTGAAIGVDTDRFLLLHHRGPRLPLDAAIRTLTGQAVRTRSEGESPYLRHADAVLPQAMIKDRFGEFAYRGPASGPITVDPRWVDANIVEADLPVLGHLRCNRRLLPALRGALDELVAANLSHLVASFEGCWNPRTIAGSTQLSRHAWGAAVDLNFSANPTGTTTVQDPRLVEVFERWGFGSGDLWLVPDSGHFEAVLAPDPRPTGRGSGARRVSSRLAAA